MHFEVIHMSYLTVIRVNWWGVVGLWFRFCSHLCDDGFSSQVGGGNLALCLPLYLLMDTHAYILLSYRHGLRSLNNLFKQLRLIH